MSPRSAVGRIGFSGNLKVRGTGDAMTLVERLERLAADEQRQASAAAAMHSTTLYTEHRAKAEAFRLAARLAVEEQETRGMEEKP